MRRLLKEIFEAEGGFEVSFARDGVEGLRMLRELKPDVVTLDVHMPNMGGLECLNQIMLENPCPVVMFSSLTDAGAKETLEALELGAVDFVLKPTGAVSLKVDSFGPMLVEKARMASTARFSRSRRLTERVRLRTGLAEAPPAPLLRRAPSPVRLTKARPPTALSPIGSGLVLVGSSTGGPPALDALLQPLPADFPWPIVVAQHMPASFTGALAARLDRNCTLTVSEVVRPTELQPGHIYIGRGDADVIVSRRAGGLVAMPAPSSPEHRWHPSVDRLVDSAMEAAPAAQLLGVLMTGMGNDGAQAMTRLRSEGGRTIAESEETAVVWGMPGELVKLDGADFIEPLDAIAERLLALMVFAP